MAAHFLKVFFPCFTLLVEICVLIIVLFALDKNTQKKHIVWLSISSGAIDKAINFFQKTLNLCEDQANRFCQFKQTMISYSASNHIKVFTE